MQVEGMEVIESFAQCPSTRSRRQSVCQNRIHQPAGLKLFYPAGAGNDYVSIYLWFFCFGFRRTDPVETHSGKGYGRGRETASLTAWSER